MWIRRSLWSVTFTTAAVLVACGGSQPAQPAGGNGNDAAVRPDGATGDGGGRSDAQISDGGKNNDATIRLDAAPDSAILTTTPPTCTLPIKPADASQPTTVVGTGSASSCTEQALAAAVAKGGVVTFYCGAATIPITQTIQFPIDKDTVIDGGNTVAFDGGGTTRIFQFNGPGSRATMTTVTLQHLDILHGKATGTPIPTAPASCGYNIDGSGAGIFVHDGKLHVVDVRFTDNHAASPGPSVGGGAIYAEGSLDVTVVGSRFTNNSGSNGGAIRSVNSDLTLVNDILSMNQATGPACSVDGGSVDGGPSSNGGNSGAVGVTGTSDGTLTICGSIFANNSAGALGGALGRSADGTPQTVSIDQTTFDGNTSVQAGGAMNIHNCNLDITASTISNNSAPGGGGIQADSTKINFVNDTFAGNSTTGTSGLGGAMALLSNGGAIQSCTFGDNHADHVPGAFAAAISGGATLMINDTIFWDNTSMVCGSPMTCQTGSSTGLADLQWPQHLIVCMNPDPACAGGGTMFADANLSPLGWNGGPTQTMLPPAGSPAIGAGASCPMTDQRGVARKPDGCTVGAVETQ